MVFLCLPFVIFWETSMEMDVKNCQKSLWKQTDNNFLSLIDDGFNIPFSILIKSIVWTKGCLGLNSKLKHRKDHKSILSRRFGNPYRRLGDWCHIRGSWHNLYHNHWPILNLLKILLFLRWCGNHWTGGAIVWVNFASIDRNKTESLIAKWIINKR